MYSPAEEIAFMGYFYHYEKVFQKECATWSEEKKIHLLLMKFGPSKHKKYANYMLLRNPREISFEETPNSEKNWWGEKFSIQQVMVVLKPDKKRGEYYSTFPGIVNREFEMFKLKELTSDMFKCLIFVQGLMAPEDGKIRTKSKNQFANSHRRM